MKLAFLQDVYENPGPFATVYLDTSGDAEDAAKAVELRWRSAREQLSGQGADEATLQAIADAIGEHQWRSGHRGKILVATQGTVVLDDELPEPPVDFSDDELVHFGQVPSLMPYLRLRGARIPYVVAVVDHTGGDVRAVNAARESGSTTVEGDGTPLHKSHSAGEGHEKQHHDAVEEQWARNATQVASEIDRQALRTGAEAIVLAGDVQQRKLVHEHLRKGLQDRVVETESSHRDRKASDEGLQREVSEAVDSVVQSRVAETVREFERERGEHDRAVDGWKNVVGALQRGQARTLLRTSTSGGEPVTNLHIGPGANEIAFDEKSLTDMGVSVTGSVPADAALVRALVGTDAELVLVDPRQTELTEGIGAVLRYSDAGSNT